MKKMISYILCFALFMSFYCKGTNAKENIEPTIEETNAFYVPLDKTVDLYQSPNRSSKIIYKLTGPYHIEPDNFVSGDKDPKSLWIVYTHFLNTNPNDLKSTVVYIPKEDLKMIQDKNKEIRMKLQKVSEFKADKNSTVQYKSVKEFNNGDAGELFKSRSAFEIGYIDCTIRSGYLNYMHHFKILEITEKSKDTFIFHVQNFIDKKIHALTIKILSDKSLSINNLLDLSGNYVLGIAEED